LQQKEIEERFLRYNFKLFKYNWKLLFRIIWEEKHINIRFSTIFYNAGLRLLSLRLPEEFQKEFKSLNPMSFLP